MTLRLFSKTLIAINALLILENAVKIYNLGGLGMSLGAVLIGAVCGYVYYHLIGKSPNPLPKALGAFGIVATALTLGRMEDTPATLTMWIVLESVCITLFLEKDDGDTLRKRLSRIIAKLRSASLGRPIMPRPEAV